MSVELLAPMMSQLGFGGIAGFIVGYSVKKILRLLLILLGLSFVALLYLAYQGFITIHYSRFTGMFVDLAKQLASGSTDGILPAFLTSNIPFLGSFAVGFSLGLSKG